jgi:hypothetical protein
VRLSEVRALALTGRHWFDPAWSLHYAIGRTRQGELYTRHGISAGLAHAF